MSDTGRLREQQRAEAIRKELSSRGLVADLPYVDIVEELTDRNERLSAALAEERHGAATRRDRTRKATAIHQQELRGLHELAVDLRGRGTPVPLIAALVTAKRDENDEAARRPPKETPIRRETIYRWLRTAMPRL